MARSSMGWSTFLNAPAFDHDAFTAELDRIAAHVRASMAAAAPTAA